tara:strand:+ start:1017 stop:1580 length:564 start_codon:yes stop_codon:yes gene_type:complete
MGYKMKGAPMYDTSSKHGTNKNFEMSGMKNTDGSPVKPGAPGMFGRIAKGVLTGGMSEIGNLFKKKNPATPTTPVDPNTAAATTAAGVPPTVPADEQAGPAVPPSGVTPPDPTLNAGPMTMKASPAKDTKTWTAKEMSGTAWMDKDAHNKKHKRKEIDADHKPVKRDEKSKKPGAPNMKTGKYKHNF